MAGATKSNRSGMLTQISMRLFQLLVPQTSFKRERDATSAGSVGAEAIYGIAGFSDSLIIDRRTVSEIINVKRRSNCLQQSSTMPLMDILLPTFKIVSVVFAISAIVTGTQAIVDPTGFSRSFGLPIPIVNKDADTSKSPSPPTSYFPASNNSNPVLSYVSLLGIRQLATGITLLTFAYSKKWTEMATVLVILGIIVAGTDGIYLARSGATNQARLHAIPGALIALLALATMLTNA